MSGTTARERIWYQMHQAYRKGSYYSDLSSKLKRRYMIFSFVIIASPLAALAVYQTQSNFTVWKWSVTKEWVVSILLLGVSLVEGYIAQSNLRGDISASRIMGVQFHKLTEKWRLLWIQQERKDIEEWVNLLEDLTNHMAVEHLSAMDKKLNTKCQEEAKIEFADQFGETITETNTEAISTATPKNHTKT